MDLSKAFFPPTKIGMCSNCDVPAMLFWPIGEKSEDIHVIHTTCMFSCAQVQSIMLDFESSAIYVGA